MKNISLQLSTREDFFKHGLPWDEISVAAIVSHYLPEKETWVDSENGGYKLTICSIKAVTSKFESMSRIF